MEENEIESFVSELEPKIKIRWYSKKYQITKKFNFGQFGRGFEQEREHTKWTLRKRLYFVSHWWNHIPFLAPPWLIEWFLFEQIKNQLLFKNGSSCWWKIPAIEKNRQWFLWRYLSGYFRFSSRTSKNQCVSLINSFKFQKWRSLFLSG